MAALPDDADRHEGHRSHEATCADADVALVVVRDIVESIDLIDAVETSLLDHRLRATGPLLRRLVKNTNRLVGAKLLLVSDQNLRYAGDATPIT